jgi:hypothetical protein
MYSFLTSSDYRSFRCIRNCSNWQIFLRVLLLVNKKICLAVVLAIDAYFETRCAQRWAEGNDNASCILSGAPLIKSSAAATVRLLQGTSTR